MMGIKYFYFFGLFLFLGCSNHSSNSNETILTSTLLDSTVAGVSYKCDGHEGVTNALGEFTYTKSCGEITFYVGSVILDSIKSDEIAEDNKLYISELVGLDRNVTSSPKVVNILQFLQSLDQNGDPSDGIQIPTTKREALKDEVLNLSDDNVSQSELSRIVSMTGDNLVDEDTAIRHFEETLSNEENITLDTRAPKFQTDVNFSVYEDKLHITTIGATDKSLPLKYTLVDGNDSRLFTINEQNGSLNFLQRIDFEEGKTEFKVKVAVFDKFQNRVEQFFNVELLDINDTPLSISSSLDKEEYFGSQTLTFSSHVAGEKYYYDLGDGTFELFENNVSLPVGKDHNISYYAEDSEGQRGEIKHSSYRVWAVVDSNGTGDFSSLYDAVQSQMQRIWIKNGLHTDPRTIEIKYSDVIVRGESRDGAIIQKSGIQSLLLVVRTHHVTVENLTLDANTYDTDDNEIWEAFGVFGSHNVTLRGCKVLGANTNDSSSYEINNQDKFAIYYAGPYVVDTANYGQELLARVESGNLDENNSIENNLIISDVRADGVSFSLQRYGRVHNNKVIGTVISYFLNRDSNCTSNIVENSSVVGIYVTLPAYNNIIDGNIIRNSRASGIRVDRQSDYREANGTILTPTTYRATGNQVTNNKIYNTRHMGIEVGQLKGSVVSGNYVEGVDYNGIHLNLIDDMNISNNVLVQGGQASNRTPVTSFAPSPAGVFVDQLTVNTVIESNRVENNDSTGFEFGIRVSAWESISGTRILNNRIIGEFNQGQISNARGDTVIEGNSFE